VVEGSEVIRDRDLWMRNRSYGDSGGVVGQMGGDEEMRG